MGRNPSQHAFGFQMFAEGIKLTQIEESRKASEGSSYILYPDPWRNVTYHLTGHLRVWGASGFQASFQVKEVPCGKQGH